jgi:hypothetical protein
MMIGGFAGPAFGAEPSASAITVNVYPGDFIVVPLVALAIAAAIGALPLLIAYWPKLAAVAAARRPGTRNLPRGLTPFSAGLLSGINSIDLLAGGFMWVIARPEARTTGVAAATSAEPEVGSNAEAYLRESLCPPGELESASEVARTTLAATNPSTLEVRAVAAGLRGSSADDARNLGLLRNSGLISRILFGVAGLELLFAYLAPGGSSFLEIWMFSSVITAWAAVHVDGRSLAGAALTADLHRLRANLREAALATGAIDSEAVRTLVPAAANKAEIEVWAVAAGCHTAGSVNAVSRLRSMAHAASGRPWTIRYTEMVLLTGSKVAAAVASPFRAVLRLDHANRRGPSGAAPVIW